LWRTIKYEEIYLKDYLSPRDARHELASYLRWYNHQRLHQSLEYRTPAETYFSHKVRSSPLEHSSVLS
jgi:putative transposase